MLISSRYLRVSNYSEEFQHRRVCLFRIIERVRQIAYKLALTDDWKTHPMFHISLLRPWREDGWTRYLAAKDPPKLKDIDEEYVQADRILRWRQVKT